MYSYLLWAIIANKPTKRFRNSYSHNLLDVSYFVGSFFSEYHNRQMWRWGWRNFFFSDFFLCFVTVSQLKAIETRIFSSAWAIIMKRSWSYSWRKRSENFPSEFSPVPTFTSFSLAHLLLIKLRLWNPLDITMNRISWNEVTTYTRKQPRLVAAVAVSEEIITTIRRRTIFTLHSFTMSLVFFFGHELC